jgi:dephospho-CoA kinase
MIVLGLTGSIAMGKSTVAAHLRSLGIPVLDSDEVVHDLYRGVAVPLVEAAFPGTTAGGQVDRAALTRAVISSPDSIARLEAIIHPLVRARQWRFLLSEHDRGTDIAVLEIPLLFETAPRHLFDAVIVVSAPLDIQRARLLERPGMTSDKLNAILARQMPDAEKRGHADYVVDTGQPLDATHAQINAVLADAAKRPALAYHRWADLSHEV